MLNVVLQFPEKQKNAFTLSLVVVYSFLSCQKAQTNRNLPVKPSAHRDSGLETKSFDDIPPRLPRTRPPELWNDEWRFFCCLFLPISRIVSALFGACLQVVVFPLHSRMKSHLYGFLSTIILWVSMASLALMICACWYCRCCLFLIVSCFVPVSSFFPCCIQFHFLVLALAFVHVIAADLSWEYCCCYCCWLLLLALAVAVALVMAVADNLANLESWLAGPFRKMIYIPFGCVWVMIKKIHLNQKSHLRKHNQSLFLKAKQHWLHVSDLPEKPYFKSSHPDKRPLLIFYK